MQGKATLPGEGGAVALDLAGRVDARGADIQQLRLSGEPTQSLALQGGPYDAAGAEAFAASAHAEAAVRLRRYDDLAKVVDLATPPLAHYLAIAARCAHAPL
ncbi:hypothetical protein D3C79_1032040 [compost metagenome]